MGFDLKLPELGENVDSGDVVSVLVKEGDEIKPEQSVFEIEAGKSVLELPCPQGGTVTKVHVSKGSKVKVGEILLSLDSGNGSSAKPAAAAAPAKAAPAEKPAVKEEPARAPATKAESAPAKPAKREIVKAEPISTHKLPPAGPATRRLARELGVDLSTIKGSGAGGRIVEDDVKAAVREGATAKVPTGPAVRTAPLPDGTDDRDKWGKVRRQKMSGIRKAIAVNMAKSASTIPHVTNFDDADITDLERIRKTGLADYVDPTVKLTMMSFVMKAVAQSLRLHPMINASVDMEKEELIFKDYVNLGVAVDTDRGLVVPVIRDVDKMSIPRIAQALTQVAEKARNNQFSLDDLKGATFTISNLGAVGGVYSTPIINHPDVAILLTGRSRKLPVVIDDKLEIRLMMPLSLSYDHRVVDGATAARFLNEIINYLKVPGRLLLAP